MAARRHPKCCWPALTPAAPLRILHGTPLDVYLTMHELPMHILMNKSFDGGNNRILNNSILQQLSMKSRAS